MNIGQQDKIYFCNMLDLCGTTCMYYEQVCPYLLDCVQTTNTHFYLYASGLTERPKPSHRLGRRDGILDAVVVAATDARVEFRTYRRKRRGGPRDVVAGLVGPLVSCVKVRPTVAAVTLPRLRRRLRFDRRGLYARGGPASLR